MTLVTRRVGKRGYVRVDSINTGPLAGQLIASISNDPDRIILMASPPSGTAQASAPGDTIYDAWDNDVNFMADWELGAPLSGPRTRAVALACWLEFWVWPSMLATDASMVNAGLTNAQRRVGLAASLFSWRVPEPFASGIAQSWVNSSQKPAYGDMGLDQPPPWVQDMSRVFDVADDEAV
jgi:hypothetical protein